MSTNAQDRGELLRLILRDGILRRTPSQPVLSRDGTPARWMLDTLSVSMQPRGAELAGRCLLELLHKFDGHQLATYGMTGVPLMQSAILQSGGKYHGLMVRKEKKAHGSMKRIEGRIDLHEPTILLDDSVSSGLSMREGTEFLEEAGLRVEGGVALVRFGWDAGTARMRERGYHMESVFDVWQDLMENMEDEPNVDRNPTRWLHEPGKFPWGGQQAPEGLHPAHLARLGMDSFLREGKLPRPPLRMDASYDSRGGVWVSLRDREEIYQRYARDGFWTFPGELAPPAPEDVLRAALQTAKTLGDDTAEAKRILDRSHIAVTFFTALEKCTPGQLDNDRYGIVVCSRERPGQMGGALPRMPGIGNEWEQFRHAHTKNAQLYSFEPYEVYRHDLRKAVEPDSEWQPSGVPLPNEAAWQVQAAMGTATARALDMVRGTESTEPLPDNLFPTALDSLYVSVYLDGRLRGCAGSAIEHPDCDIRALVEAAMQDDRFTQNNQPERIAVTVSLLSNRLELGEMSAEEVAPRFRLGKQALAVQQNKRQGMLLPFVAVTNNLNALEFAAEVIDKAGITRAPYHWIRFDCTTWLADERGVEPVEYGFRQPAQALNFNDTLRDLTKWHCEYLIRNMREDGGLYATFEPFQNYLYRGHGTPRGTHAMWVLMRAGEQQNAGRLLDAFLAKIHDSDAGLWLEEEDNSPSVAELSFTLLTLAELAEQDSRRAYGPRISAALWARIDKHGRIATHRGKDSGTDEFQNYFPGQMLLALARASQAGFCEPNQTRLRNAFLYYRHRFRYKRNFGQVSWLMQAGRLWWEVTGDSAWMSLVFEIADWILRFQLDSNGGFITPFQQDGPGYTTALFLEGLASAARLAAAIGDRTRYLKYMSACEKGINFLRRLTIGPEHESLLPNPTYARGGLRRSFTASEIRLDFVQHSLAAALDIQCCFGLPEASNRSLRVESVPSRQEPIFQPGD